MVHAFLNLAALFVLQLIILRGKSINLHCVITKTAETHRLDQTSPVIFKVFVPTGLLSWDQHTSASQKRLQLPDAPTTLPCLKQKNIFSFFSPSAPLALLSLSLSLLYFFFFQTVHHCGFIHFMFSETPLASQHKTMRCRKSLIS